MVILVFLSFVVLFISFTFILFIVIYLFMFSHLLSF